MIPISISNIYRVSSAENIETEIQKESCPVFLIKYRFPTKSLGSCNKSTSKVILSPRHTQTELRKENHLSLGTCRAVLYIKLAIVRAVILSRTLLTLPERLKL